ncbi:MAG: hypothetical protein CVU05_04210 [Bacteroidetes bacterium HGW-Bacteroidetes-21]|nr:MAG: hypothetical protein CVU05_04210 [Bacteroidetes bacterium HGW-Bacteroidetes-21]
MYRTVIPVFFALSLFLFSCSGGGYKTTPSGLQYQFFEENSENPLPGPKDILEIEMTYKTENDSVLFDTRELGGSPFRMKNKLPEDAKGVFIEEGLSMMHEGDSARFVVDAESFFLITQGREIPDGIKKGSKLIFDIRLKKILNMNTYRNEKNGLFASNEQEEQTLLESYLKNGNIVEQPTNSGLYFVEEIKGKGKKPEAGSTVVINYTGTYINGQIFDSSLERGETFQFRFGASEVIAGLEEGVSYMKEGGKATLIIPSHLAYKDETGNKIPPFSTLIFYVELIEVK